MNAKLAKLTGILLFTINLGWPALSSAGPSDQGTWGLQETTMPTEEKQSAADARCEKGYQSDHLNSKGLQAWYQPAHCRQAESPCPYAGRASDRVGPPAAKGLPFNPGQGGRC
jgi:hypothetical protein